MMVKWSLVETDELHVCIVLSMCMYCPMCVLINTMQRVSKLTESRESVSGIK